ncbi:MAG: hypothetical protein HON23_04300 [Rickettsiales bacterium]|jgi:hypothetical protein|nr:hypothetical protein [Rickettsiales bacterium]
MGIFSKTAKSFSILSTQFVDMLPLKRNRPGAEMSGAEMSGAELPSLELPVTALSDDAEINTAEFFDDPKKATLTAAEFKKHFFIEEGQEISQGDVDRTLSVLQDIAGKFNMRVSDVINFSEFALTNDTPIIFRPINPDVPKHLKNGAVGKGFATKEKSASRDAGEYLAGLIPTKAAFSKLGFHADLKGENSANAVNKISDFQKKADTHLREDATLAKNVKEFIDNTNPDVKITKAVFANGAVEYSMITDGVTSAVEIPPIMPLQSSKGEAINSEISTEELGKELSEKLTHRIHTPTPVLSEDKEQLYSFTNQDGSPFVNQENQLIVCTDTGGQFVDIASKGVIPITDDLNKEPLEVMSYSNFEIKLDDHQKLVMKTLDPIKVTADFDQLTEMKNGIDHNAEGIMPDQTAQYGFGSNQDYAVTKGLQEDNHRVIAHNQEHGNTKYAEAFTDDIYPSFASGPRIEYSPDATEFDKLKDRSANNLVNLVMSNKDVEQGDSPKLSGCVSFPRGEEGVADLYKERIGEGYDVHVNPAWKVEGSGFNSSLWSDVDDKYIQKQEVKAQAQDAKNPLLPGEEALSVLPEKDVPSLEGKDNQTPQPAEFSPSTQQAIDEIGKALKGHDIKASSFSPKNTPTKSTQKLIDSDNGLRSNQRGVL